MILYLIENKPKKNCFWFCVKNRSSFPHSFTDRFHRIVLIGFTRVRPSFSEYFYTNTRLKCYILVEPNCNAKKRETSVIIKTYIRLLTVTHNHQVKKSRPTIAYPTVAGRILIVSVRTSSVRPSIFLESDY